MNNRPSLKKLERSRRETHPDQGHLRQAFTCVFFCARAFRAVGVDLKPGDVGRQRFWYEGSEFWNESNKNRYEMMRQDLRRISFRQMTARSSEQHSYQNAEYEKDDKDKND